MEPTHIAYTNAQAVGQGLKIGLKRNTRRIPDRGISTVSIEESQYEFKMNQLLKQIDTIEVVSRNQQRQNDKLGKDKSNQQR